ncbi:SO2930 family diheme c-type cytochrome [Sphingomonas sp. ST-64]|uniref:SO2930 family diheme c-type cytochrome n=1 Tax=Sphingomonas plantiphila TaxID=3163295 RepID=A0ABW8YHG6_9SPHN
MKRAGLIFLAIAGALFGVAAANQPVRVNDAAILQDGYSARLSDYRFFADLTARAPSPRVIGYDLETPLFSDYARKQRFIYVPAGKSAVYDPKQALDLPVGSALIKTFGYGDGAAFRPLETRLLLRRASGWVAIPYVWNAEGTDAMVKRAGTRLPVAFTDSAGRARQISYAVPNQNQCKDCHALAGAITPIGVKARYLNHDGQLQTLVRAGLLDRVPAEAPRVARWDDASAPLDARARAYLEINCAHCHNPQGAASNSGLFLELDRADPVALGIGKRPVAAGRGSGGRAVAIQPGDAEASILIYRLRSTDPGIAMPELGRATAHEEGIALLSQWIDSLPAR